MFFGFKMNPFNAFLVANQHYLHTDDKKPVEVTKAKIVRGQSSMQGEMSRNSCAELRTPRSVIVT